jgi:hypothetical protein
MSNTKTTPEEKLAGGKIEVEPGTLGNLALALGAAATTVTLGVSDSQKVELDKDLDPKRIKKKPGKGYDYLAVHDVERTANRIFGYGRWGTEVVDLEHLGTVQVTNTKNEKGWYTGYRCTVRLTVAGCEPVDGVGYGDAFEKQWSGQITTHELAAKEAESDAEKRAFKKYGDQFGLILYAKDDEKRNIAAAKAEDEYNAAAPDELVAELRRIGEKLGNVAIGNALDAEIVEHGRARTGWLTRALAKAREMAANGADTEPSPAAQGPREGVDTASGDKPPASGDSAPQGAVQASAGDVATDAQVKEFIRLAGLLGEKGHAHANTLIVEHLAANDNVVSAGWLAEQTGNVVKALAKAGIDTNVQEQIDAAFGGAA